MTKAEAIEIALQIKEEWAELEAGSLTAKLCRQWGLVGPWVWWVYVDYGPLAYKGGILIEVETGRVLKELPPGR